MLFSLRFTIQELDELENDFYINSLEEVQKLRTPENIERLRTILLHRAASFGTKESPAKMSGLEPIQVALKDYNKVLKATPKWMTKRHLIKLKEKLENMLKKGMIRPTSNPYYGSNIFLLDKPNGDVRLITDMRPLNELTQDTSMIMPNLEEQVSYPEKAKIFSSFDILSSS